MKLFLAGLVLAGLVGCGGGETKAPAKPADKTAPVKDAAKDAAGAVKDAAKEAAGAVKETVKEEAK